LQYELVCFVSNLLCVLPVRDVVNCPRPLNMARALTGRYTTAAVLQNTLRGGTDGTHLSWLRSAPEQTDKHTQPRPPSAFFVRERGFLILTSTTSQVAMFSPILELSPRRCQKLRSLDCRACRARDQIISASGLKTPRRDSSCRWTRYVVALNTRAVRTSDRVIVGSSE
jgi:hypothetical protein